MKFLLVVFIHLNANNQLIHHFGVPYDTLAACEAARKLVVNSEWYSVRTSCAVFSRDLKSQMPQIQGL
jgi:hypothetical protein